jgi:hypothetical protein
MDPLHAGRDQIGFAAAGLLQVEDTGSNQGPPRLDIVVIDGFEDGDRQLGRARRSWLAAVSPAAPPPTIKICCWGMVVGLGWTGKACDCLSDLGAPVNRGGRC